MDSSTSLSEKTGKSGPASPLADGSEFEDLGSVATCENCGKPQKESSQAWCPHCGYYPLLGKCVELNPWDQEDHVPEEEEEAEVNPWLFMYRSIPRWGWVLAGGILVLLLVSVYARVLIPTGSSIHRIWGCTQLGIGFLAFAATHIVAYVLSMMDSDNFNLLDIFLRPIAVWGSIISRLPGTEALVYVGGWGLAASLLAVLVVGGQPYDRLWDWGIKERAKLNLVHAITENAPPGEEMDMEDALKDFAGEAGINDLEGKKNLPQQPERNKRVDCLIIGYVPINRDKTDIRELLVATDVRSTLQYVGLVSTSSIPISKRIELLQKMRDLETDRPIVPCEVAAKWLRPKLLCRIKFVEWNSREQLELPLFDTMLAEFEP